MKPEITNARIDMLWKRRSFYIGAALAAIDDCLAAIYVVACEECGGSGEVMKRREYFFDTGNSIDSPEDCPDCHGHGWIKK